MYDPNACSIFGGGSKQWSWQEYKTNKAQLEAAGVQVVLVDMINHPVEDAVLISNELFMSGKYPEGTYFCLYCHSGGSSGFLQKQLEAQLPKYKYVNMGGGIASYTMQQSNSTTS